MKVSVPQIRLLRLMLRKNDKKRQKKYVPETELKTLLNVDCMNDRVFSHMFDIYYAPAAVRKNRVIIDIHGGSYVYSDRKNNACFASVLAHMGYDVVTLDYPRNDGRQENIAQIRILAKQLRYLYFHAAKLELNAKAMFLLGDSAGGHYALLLAEAAENPAIRRKLGLDMGAIYFNGLAVCSPVYDLVQTAAKASLTHAAKRWLFGPSWGDEIYLADISPRTYYRELNTPLFLSTCTRDFIREQSMLLKEDADANKKEITFFDETSPNKDVVHVYNVIDVTLPESKKVNAKIIEFFDSIHC